MMYHLTKNDFNHNLVSKKAAVVATTQDYPRGRGLLVPNFFLKSRSWTMLQGEYQMLVQNEAPYCTTLNGTLWNTQLVMGGGRV